MPPRKRKAPEQDLEEPSEGDPSGSTTTTTKRALKKAKTEGKEGSTSGAELIMAESNRLLLPAVPLSSELQKTLHEMFLEEETLAWWQPNITKILNLQGKNRSRFFLSLCSCVLQEVKSYPEGQSKLDLEFHNISLSQLESDLAAPEIRALLIEIQEDPNKIIELLRFRPLWLPDGEAKGEKAFTLSWKNKFLGNAQQTFYEACRNHYNSTDALGILGRANCVSVVQSSGTGKSRMMDELSKSVWMLPLNLNKHDGGYPRPDAVARDWIQSWTKDPQGWNDLDLLQTRVQALFVALFEELIILLETENLKHPSELHGYFAPSQDQATCENRHNFYDKVVDRAENLSTTSPRRSGSSESPVFLFQEPPSSSDRASTSTTTADTRVTVLSKARELVEKLGSRAWKKEGKQEPLLFISFDEAQVLVRSRSERTPPWAIRRTMETLLELPIMCTLISTTGSLLEFIPRPKTDNPSWRPQAKEPSFLPSYWALGFDQLVPSLSGTETIHGASEIASQVMFGRPLFGAVYSIERDDDWILKFASDKLMMRQGWCENPSRSFLSSDDAKLASIIQRIPVEMNTSAGNVTFLQRTLVEKQLRILMDVRYLDGTVVTRAPSEPILSEAARLCWRLGSFDVIKILDSHLGPSSFLKGDRGETMAMALLLRAMDYTASASPSGPSQRISPRPSSPKRVTGFLKSLFNLQYHDDVLTATPSNRPGPSLKEVLSNARVWFNHWLRTEGDAPPNSELLTLAIRRGSAICGVPGQEGIDLMIPFVTDSAVAIGGDNLGLILIQVKNKRDLIHPKALHFKGMEHPSDLPNPDKMPIIRIFLSFHAPPGVTSYRYTDTPTRSEPPGAAPYYYDLWVGGRSQNIWDVIDSEDEERTILTMLQGDMNIYESVQARAGDVVVAHLRRMNPLTEPGSMHVEGTKGILPR